MAEITVSWIVLTFNRAEVVTKSVAHNMARSGRMWDEMVWVDNGSTDGVRDFMSSLFPDVTVLNKKNLGVARGYNQAMAMCKSSHVVITGCDMLMPDDWLSHFVNAFQTIKSSGVVTMYSDPIEKTPERIRGREEIVNGVRVVAALPIGRKMFRRDLLQSAGYLHEGFGLYGWEDVAWAHTVEKICEAKGLSYYNLKDYICEHLGTEGNVSYDQKDAHEYWEFKKEQVRDAKKMQLMESLRGKEWPPYFPF